MSKKNIGIALQDETYLELAIIAAAEDLTVDQLSQRVLTRFVKRTYRKANGLDTKKGSTFELHGSLNLVVTHQFAAFNSDKVDEKTFEEWKDALRNSVKTEVAV